MNTDWDYHWKSSDNLISKFKFWRIKVSYKKISSMIKAKNVKILELGSGTGINSLTLSKGIKTKKVTLVDSNKKAIEISKNTFKNSKIKVKYLMKNVLDLKLKEKFDIVHSEGLIEHFYGKNRMEIFKKHAELCKKRGFIIIFVPYKSIQYTLFKKILKTLGKWIWDEEPFLKEELYDMCKRLNLKIIGCNTSILIHEIGVLLKV